MLELDGRISRNRWLNIWLKFAPKCSHQMVNNKMVWFLLFTMTFISIFRVFKCYFDILKSLFLQNLFIQSTKVIVWEINVIFESCKDRSRNSKVYGEFVFWLFHTSIKWKRSPSICFNTLVMLSELSIKVSSPFPILFRLVKFLIVKRDLMESPLSSFRTA